MIKYCLTQNRNFRGKIRLNIFLFIISVFAQTLFLVVHFPNIIRQETRIYRGARLLPLGNLRHMWFLFFSNISPFSNPTSSPFITYLFPYINQLLISKNFFYFNKKMSFDIIKKINIILNLPFFFNLKKEKWFVFFNILRI